MSVLMVTWAIETEIQPVSKLILVLLADCCGHADQTKRANECWPSIGYLQARTMLKRRCLYKHLSILEEAGFIVREFNRAANRTHYFLNCQLQITGQLRPKSAPVPVQRTPEDTPEIDDDVEVEPVHARALDEPVDSAQKGLLGVHARAHGTLRGTVREKEKETSLRSSKKNEPHGCRLPDDWTPGEAGAKFAREVGVDPQSTFDAFRDYWVSTVGPRGKKADWSATWRNWCRKAAADKARYRSVDELDDDMTAEEFDRLSAIEVARYKAEVDAINAANAAKAQSSLFSL